MLESGPLQSRTSESRRSRKTFITSCLCSGSRMPLQTGKSCDAPPANHLKMRDLVCPDKFLKTFTKRNSYLWFSLWI
jgi:hypothetical protein